MDRRTKVRAAPVAAAVLLLAAACGGSDSTSSASGSGGAAAAPPSMAAAGSVGTGEGQLNIIAWAGYAEDGSNDTTVDWVTPFEQQTGCQVNVKIGNTSDEMVTLMKTGQYDGVSASGDATLRLIYSGDVAPVNTSLVPDYATVAEFLKNRPWNSVNGQMYGIPHGWGANVLAWRTDKVSPPPDTWGSVFDADSPYKGKITAYDSPIYIADAALYLKATKPDLKITNPYELDDTQFQATVDLLKQQRALVGEYWSDYTKAVQALESGDTVLGTQWQVNVNLVNGGSKAKVDAVVPKEGSTGWSDTWMVSSKAKHPNCMYKWMNHIISPKANAEVAEWFGEAPANSKSCGLTADPNHCKIYHADDEAYFDKVAYWTTPISDCGDGRGQVCKDYSEWTRAWTEIKG
ncbi:MAG: ABC transporter substrate-binding protein [Actinomycetes bacterium]